MTTATAPKIDHAAAAVAHQALREAQAALFGTIGRAIDASQRPCFRADYGSYTTQPPSVYRAELGRQRAFVSRTDALAYDAGWSMYPATCYAEAGTPASMGWFDCDTVFTGGAAAADDVLGWAFTHATACGVHP